MKRLLALVLCLVMCVSLIPAAAAEDDIEIVEIDEIAEESPEEELITVVDPETSPDDAADKAGREYKTKGFVFRIENGEATLTGYEGSKTDVTIPGKADGVPVTAIGPYAFSGNKNIVSVTIPASVERIESGEIIGFSVAVGESVQFIDEGTYAAFYNCDALKKVTIPSDGKLSYIGEWTFWFCDNLSSITLPSSIRTLAQSCFQDCPALTSITLPEGLVEVGQNAFTGTGLTSLNLPSTLTEFHPWIYMDHLKSFTVTGGNPSYRAKDGVLYANGTHFSGTDPENWYIWIYPAAKQNSVYTPPSFTGEDLNLDYLNGGVSFNDRYWPHAYLKTLDVGSRRFDFISYTTYRVKLSDDNPYYTLKDGLLYSKDMSELLVAPSSLTGTVELDGRVKSIADMAGFACSASAIEMPYGLERIGAYAFRYCAKLREIRLPDSVTDLGIFAFANCSALKTARLSSTLAKIPEGCFYSCSSMTQLILPLSVKKIGEYAFNRCDSLTDVYFAGRKSTAESRTGQGWQTAGNEPLFQASWHYKSNGPDEKPAITVQPKSQTVKPNTTVKFSVTAAGAESYQWYYRTSNSGSWTKCSSGAGATLTVEAKTYRDGYQYRCKVSNGVGSVYSNTATLTIASKPTITTQPKSVAVCAGETATFTVKADGAESYQWQFRKSADAGWSSCSDGTGASFSVEAKTYRNGYQYRCKVTNGAGATYSNAATLSVKPGVTTQPKSVTVCAGETATFTVKADGAESYQWQFRKSADAGWSSCSDGTGAAFSVEAKTYRDGYQYRCRLTNSAGTTYSEAATLRVLPRIDGQPADQTAAAGETVFFSVSAVGADSFQWYFRSSETGAWSKCSGTGATTATLTVEAKSYRNGYQYRCRLTNSAGSVYSAAATLTVN